MSASAGALHQLIALTGPVQCEQPPGAVNLVLRGHASAGLTEVLFSDATPLTLPAGLHDIRVFEMPGASASALVPATALAPASADAARHFCLQGPQLALAWRARSVQLHRDAATAFYRALPPPRVPLRLRLGWSLLLAALRLPGAVTLIRILRGSA